MATAALCNSTREARQAHAAALIEDGGPKSRATGAVALGQIARGCGATSPQ